VEIEKDLGDEIIMKLKDLITKYNKLLVQPNEKELTNTHIPRNTS